MIELVVACQVIAWYHSLPFDWRAALAATHAQYVREKEDFRARSGR